MPKPVRIWLAGSIAAAIAVLSGCSTSDAPAAPAPSNDGGRPSSTASAASPTDAKASAEAPDSARRADRMRPLIRPADDHLAAKRPPTERCCVPPRRAISPQSNG
ncbi:MAG TPA: hypothetical protein VIP98_03310, partial [Microlunatus sp.]